MYCKCTFGRLCLCLRLPSTSTTLQVHIPFHAAAGHPALSFVGWPAVLSFNQSPVVCLQYTTMLAPKSVWIGIKTLVSPVVYHGCPLYCLRLLTPIFISIYELRSPKQPYSSFFSPSFTALHTAFCNLSFSSTTRMPTASLPLSRTSRESPQTTSLGELSRMGRQR